MIRVITGGETAKRLAVSLNCKVSASEQKIFRVSKRFFMWFLDEFGKTYYFLFFTDDVQTVIFPAILQKLKNLTAEINRKMSSERSISDDIFTN